MLHYFIQLNFASVMLLFCLLVFMNTNRIFERKNIRIFSVAAVLILILITVDSIEAWCAALKQPVVLRIWMSAIGYSLRPVIVYIVILFIHRNEPQKRKRYLWAIPLAFNVLVAFSALFTDIAYSYDAANRFVRGPLGVCPFIVSGIYLIALMTGSIQLYKDGNNSEALITIVMTVFTAISVAMEALLGYDGVINMSGSVMIVFYYLYFVTQSFKRDSLTKVLNRRSFYSDAENREKDIVAVISLDLNNLKVINDTQGHDKGDLAICTMARVVQKQLLPNCYLYRMGGDEFMILCFQERKSDIDKMVVQIKEAMQNTPYRCGVGIAYTNEFETFDQICKMADRAMYANKGLLKQGESRR